MQFANADRQTDRLKENYSIDFVVPDLNHNPIGWIHFTEIYQSLCDQNMKYRVQSIPLYDVLITLANYQLIMLLQSSSITNKYNNQF